ncbi:MAG TPA: alpha-galactosidase [Dehalococcoidia bacterium]|nr:alpha-galactosidase [Dehalococcoidia bacterium]
MSELPGTPGITGADGPIRGSGDWAVLLADGRRLLPADFRSGQFGANRREWRDGERGLRVTFEGNDGFMSAGERRTLTLTNSGSVPIELAEILVWCAESRVEAPGLTSPAGRAVWLHSRQMNGPVLSHRFAQGEAHPSYPASYVRRSAHETAYISASMSLDAAVDSTASELRGFITTARQFGELRWLVSTDESQTLRREAACLLDGWILRPEESVSSETLLYLQGEDPLLQTDEYARATAAAMQARVPPRAPSGWCSWYFYWNRVSEADVLQNLAALRRERGAVELVQIDDGWQSTTGDWLTANERFPSGMAALAGRIREAGFTPGLWLAPLVLHKDSQTFREHPDWAIRNRDGSVRFLQTWLGECAALDCTHPEARAWLRKVIGTAVTTWGYPYLKLDALVFAAQEDARYHEPNTTAAMNLRRGLEVCREAAGEETFILGCTCPFGPAIGLVDAMRVGPDVDALWFNGERPSAFQSLRMTLPRWFMHRRFWRNDPDCLVARDRADLTLVETRTLATGIAISGGNAMLSDDLAALSPERRALAESVLPPYGVAARPVDLLERELPRLFSFEQEAPRQGRRVVALFNWEDEPQAIAIDFAQLGVPAGQGQHVFEFWERLYRGVLQNGVPAERIEPHACRLYLLTPDAGHPCVVGAAAHTSMGALAIAAERWEAQRRELRITLAPSWERKDSLFIGLGDDRRDAGFSVSGATGAERAGALLRIDVDPALSREIAIAFAG